MLKVVNDGVMVELIGRNKNPLYMLSFVLVGLAICVAVVAITMPVEIAIGTMAAFAVLVFCFNILKKNLKNHNYIGTGTFTAKDHQFISNQQSVKLSQDVKIDIANDTLIIKDVDGVWQISGFENEQELTVVHAVLLGRKVQKQEKTIKMSP